MVGLKLHGVDLLINYWYSWVIEWLGLAKFGKVWCGMVWICGADTAFRDNIAASLIFHWPLSRDPLQTADTHFDF